MNIRRATTRVAFGLLAAATMETATAQEEGSDNTKPSELERTLTGIERIELMKRGLDSDKSLQPGGGQDFVPTVTGEAQTLPGKLLDLGTDETSESEKSDEWKSRNWLIHGVDSLEKGDRAEEDLDATESLENKPTQGSAEFWLQLAMEKTEADEEESKDSGEGTLKNPDALSTTNPLNDFMTDWLSTEELARLDISDSSLTGLPGESQISTALQLDLGETDRLLRATESLSQAVAVPGARGPNPYLDLKGEAGPLGSFSDILPPPGATTRREPSRVNPIQSPTRPATGPTNNDAGLKEVKEPWKPPAKEDDKYFRRLNRF